jgi:hypothetical protein
MSKMEIKQEYNSTFPETTKLPEFIPDFKESGDVTIVKSKCHEF